MSLFCGGKRKYRSLTDRDDGGRGLKLGAKMLNILTIITDSDGHTHLNGGEKEV